MCSTPRGSGISRRSSPVEIDEGDNADYLKMLQRASRKFDQHERGSQQKEATEQDIAKTRSK